MGLPVSGGQRGLDRSLEGGHAYGQLQGCVPGQVYCLNESNVMDLLNWNAV